MAQDRETRIPESDGVEVPEGWELDGDGFTVGAEQQDSLFTALVDATTILRHIGGVVQIAPVRQKLGDNVYVTREYAFQVELVRAAGQGGAGA
jgi:hypothetical protein